MLRWCAFCQSFLGETPPIEDYSISHGVCRDCMDTKRYEDSDAIDKARVVSKYLESLRTAAQTGEYHAAGDLLDQAEGLGIKSMDLVMGLIQPALYEIGELWSRNVVTVADEHRFTSMSQAIVNLIFDKYPAIGRLRNSATPTALLSNAEGNYHVLGLQILELLLCLSGVRTNTIIPGIPTKDLLSLVNELRPKVIGISIALPEQRECVERMALELEALPPEERPLLMVGGFPVRQGLTFDPKLLIRATHDINEFRHVAMDIQNQNLAVELRPEWPQRE